MMRVAGKLPLVLLFVFQIACCGGVAFAGETVRLSSTIGPIDAGIVPLLAKTYEEKTGTKIIYEGAGTGATLEKAKSGGFDMVIVHARALEDRFVRDGFGIDRRDIMYNDFVILGPANDPAKIKGMRSAAEAFARIAKAKMLFVTRGDNSGTHVKEMEVWAQANIKPDSENEAWYLEYALGNLGNTASTLFADKRGAYILMDRATYLMQKKNIKLIPLVEKDSILLNFIAAIQVNPEKFPDINAKGARAFIDWMCRDEAQAVIKDFQVSKYGEPLFFPNSDEWNREHGKK